MTRTNGTVGKAVVGLLLLGACNRETAAVIDAGHDASVVDVSDDGPQLSDVESGDANDAADADGEAGTSYSALTDQSKWSTFDVTTLNSAAAAFAGAAFDGRYLYLVPTAHVVARYDTLAAFTTSASWSTFDMTTLNASIPTCEGAAFDGRYVYFAPSYDSGTVARYDTTATFTATSSWSTFDATTVDNNARFYAGATFDGRYVYFVPAGTAQPAVVARYDTQVSFTSASAWSTFDLAAINGAAMGFRGAVFDGRYMYLIPYFSSTVDDGGSDVSGLVVRYDTTSPFTTSNSWTIFDTGTVNGQARGFAGGAFDGRYVYLVPRQGPGSGQPSLATRYDTTLAFDTTAAWSTFDVTNVNAGASGFIGAAFDGRFVYYVPWSSSWPTTDGLLVRYDTQATFTSSSAWSTFDVTTVKATANGFWGAAFDGRYLYLVPLNNSGTPDGVVARFDAKLPPSLPPGYAHGSFL